MVDGEDSQTARVVINYNVPIPSSTMEATMAESVWLQMRQASESLRQGRLEEADERLREPLQKGYWRAFRIARKLAHAYAVRAQRALWSGQYTSAWQDLLRAEALHPRNPTLVELREELTQRELRRFRAMLGRRDLDEATELLHRLSQRQVPADVLEPLYELTLDYSRLLRHAQRGDFSQAWQQYKRLKVPEWFASEYQALGEELQQRQAQFESALPRLLQAVQQGQHDEVILAAQAILDAAPDYRRAIELRELSWQALRYPNSPQVSTAAAVTLSHVPAARSASPWASSPPTRSFSPSSTEEKVHRPFPSGGIPSRLILWVNHVGSYLVCLSNGVTIGGHGYEHPPAIPVCADLPRYLAEFCFDSEGFWLQTNQPKVFLNGRRIQQSDLLKHGDRITLGETCELQFLQPHPLFQTAVLRITSGHRLPLAIDAVILMGQQLVLGRHAQAHIPLPRPINGRSPPGDLCLCRSPEGLGVRVPEDEPFTIRRGQQSQTCRGWGIVHPGSMVEWGSYSFTLETDHALRT
jgi:hypothetical protein